MCRSPSRTRGGAGSKLRDLQIYSVYYGEILSEATEHHLDMQNVGALIALTDNEAYNSLVCTEFGPEIGRSRVFQLGREDNRMIPHGVAFTRCGRAFFKSGMTLEDLIGTATFAGWTFQKTKLSDQYDFQDLYRRSGLEDIEVLAVLRKSRRTSGILCEQCASGGGRYSSSPLAEQSATSQKNAESPSLRLE